MSPVSGSGNGGLDFLHGAAVGFLVLEAQFAFRTNLLPLAQRIDDDRGEGDVALTGLRFGWTDIGPIAGALPDMNNTGIEIDIALRA
jgi:hypothetical protein